mgnify:CR=1 FL=1
MGSIDRNPRHGSLKLKTMDVQGHPFFYSTD